MNIKKSLLIFTTFFMLIGPGISLSSPFLVSDPYLELTCDRSNLPSICNSSYPTTCPLPPECDLPPNCVKNKPASQPTSFEVTVDSNSPIDSPTVFDANNKPILSFDVGNLSNGNHTISVKAKTSSAISCPTEISFKKESQ